MRGFLLIVVAVIFLLSLLTGLSMVEPGEKAVVLRFGKIIDTRGPGLYVGLPWGIDQVYRVKVDRVRSVKIGFLPEREDDMDLSTPPGQLLTGDHNLVNIQAVVFYAVREDEVARFVFQQQLAESLVARAAETVLNEWTSGREYDTVFERGKLTQAAAPGESTLRDLLVEQTQKILDQGNYKLGVVISDARVTYLNPPSEVKNAYDAVTRAKTQMKTEKYKAEQYRASLEQTTQAEEHQILNRAEGDAEAKVQLAQAVAKNFSEQLKQYKELRGVNSYYLNAIWWDEMSRLYAKMRAGGRLDLLDHHLANGGLNITTMPNVPKKR